MSSRNHCTTASLTPSHRTRGFTDAKISSVLEVADETAHPLASETILSCFNVPNHKLQKLFQLTLRILTTVHYLNKLAVPNLLRCNSSLMFGEVSAMADADAAYCNQHHSTPFTTFILLALRWIHFIEYHDVCRWLVHAFSSTLR